MQQYEIPRQSGVLMPIYSLPGGHGIGSMGKPSMDFLEFLHKAGQKIWQILPVGPTGCGNSPYASCSAFAGNPNLIDLDLLTADGLLKKSDYSKLDWGSDPSRIDYDTVIPNQMAMLRKAYANWKKRRPIPGYDTWRDEDFNAFLCGTKDWLEDYALFMAAKAENEQKDWQSWPEALRTRRPEALAALRKSGAEEMEFWRFVQYIFDKQWQGVKARAKQLGIMIMGDMPIYVSADSADAWASPELFETDEKGHPARVAGCPPDFFSEDGQHWGNPLYAWPRHKATGYAWWVRRVRNALYTYDLLRIDHFRGFDTYWAIPAGEKTARNGKWELGPGLELFQTMEDALGPLPLVAEDLGEAFDSVRKLLADSKFPGMKVLQFAFGGGENAFLPHNHIHNCVVYPGTHDNTTTRDWLENVSTKKERAFVKKYLPAAPGETQTRAVVRAAMASPAKLAVVALQDWLELGPEGRMNIPGTVGANWNWRAQKGDCSAKLAAEMKALALTYLRYTEK